MKFLKSFLLSIVLLGLLCPMVFASSENISVEQKKVLGKNINIVTVDFNNTNVTFDIVKGNNQRAGWEDFASIIDRTKPAAAINGNYFNAYATEETEIVPWGYIYKNGNMINNGATINRGSFAVTFDRQVIINNGEAFLKNNIETMVEAGPLLILDGIIVYDPDNTEFTEDKINLNSGPRSAIGLKPNGHVLMVTGFSLRMIELANIMHELGCVAATNLDGGASSALYANGKYITNPGRKLNTVLVVYNQEAQAATDYNATTKAYNVKVFIDSASNEIEFTKDSGKPFIALGRTFVPYRILCERLEAEVGWDNNLRKVTAVGNNNKVELYIGNPKFYVNGKSRTMDVEPFILATEGRTYIPARYVSEGMGYSIDYISKDGKMYVVVFTKGQTEAQKKAVLEAAANIGDSNGKDKPVPIPVKPPNGGNGGFTPIADPKTYRVDGNHYYIYEEFNGEMETSKYAIIKESEYIGGGADVVTIYPKTINGEIERIAVTCTSHPELNTMNHHGSINNMTKPRLQYQIKGEGYEIPITEGMTIELEATNGDSFTITI